MESTQFSFVIILLSNLYINVPSKSLFVGPLAGFFKCLTFLLLDFGVTFASHLSGLSVCHTKHIISLNTSIDATVSWNGLSQGLHAFVLRSYVYSVECGCCTVNILGNFSNFPGLGKVSEILFLSSNVRILLMLCISWKISSIESVLLGG